MEKNKKIALIVSIALAVLLVASIVLNIISITFYVSLTKNANKEIKNVILLIGDGMGFNHLEQTKKAKELESLHMESMSLAQCATDSIDGVTDSAAGGTALATGYKTKNGYVARSPQNDQTTLKSIMQYAQEAQKATGVITTDNPYGATPSAFSSHSSSRFNHDNLLERQFASEIDLIVSSIYEEDGGDKTSARANEIRGNGYNYVTSYNALTSAKNSSKIYGVLPTLHSQYVSQNNVELSDVADFALSYLSQDKDGFMLMIEGARIDKFSHDNNMEGMVEELQAFDEAIATCLDWAKWRNDTVVLVTADHETGGITLTNENKYVFTTSSHTGAYVPLFSYGVTLNELTYDNTDVFKICHSLCQTGKYVE